MLIQNQVFFNHKKTAFSFLLSAVFVLVVILNARAWKDASNPILQLNRIGEIPGDFPINYRNQNYIYAPLSGDLDIINIQNSAYPQLVNSISGISGFYITFDDHYAYLSTGTSVIFLDISEPENPLPINVYSEFEPIGNVYPFVDDLAVYGQTLYVRLDYFADRCPLAGKIAILDISDPLNPARIGTIEYPDGLGDIEIVGDKLLVLKLDTMLIYNLTLPDTLILSDIITLGSVYHRGGSMRLVNDYLLLNFGPVSYPCFSAGDYLSVVADVSQLPEVSLLFSQVDPSKVVNGYTDGFIFTGGIDLMEVRSYPDFYIPAAEFIETFYFIDVYEGFIQAPEPENFIPAYLTTLRLSSASETVDHTVSATLAYTDTLGVTSIILPAGTVLSPTVVSVLPLPKADFPPLLSTQVQAFDIRGHLPDYQLTLQTFQTPVTATLPVTVSQPSFTTTRAFLYWTGTHWVDAATTCASQASFPEISEFPGNSNTVHFCRPGKYGVFELPVLDHDLYLPAVFRQPS